VASYLSPNGVFILIWNLECEATQWNKDLRQYYQAHDRGTPQFYKGWWRRGFETEAYKELFQPQEEKTVSWEVGMTEDQVSSRDMHSYPETDLYECECV
jgi:hypothetical protein